MKRRLPPQIVVVLCLSLFVINTVQGGPVQIKNVQQVITGTSKAGWQDGSSILRPTTPTSLTTNDPNDPKKVGNNQQQQQDPTGPVRTEEVVEFVIDEECNCPEPEPLVVAKAGFPWWVLGTGAVPLAFVDKKKRVPPDVQPTPSPTPPPNPTPTPPSAVPEPATLLLFGSGILALGVGVRRRFGRNSISEETTTVGEE